MLAAGGLDPDKDVVMIPMGREPIRLQALLAGSIDASPLPVPLHAIAEEKGMNLLADIEGKFEVPFSGVTVTERKLRDNADEVKRFIRAMVKAGRYFLSHHDESVALYMNWLKLSKAIAEDAYTRSIKSVSPDGLGKDSAIKTQLGLIKQTTGKDVKVDAVIDLRRTARRFVGQREPVHRVVAGQEVVVRELVAQIEPDEQCRGEADREARDVDRRHELVARKVAQRGGEVVPQHRDRLRRPTRFR
jgi:hypothetical protein